MENITFGKAIKAERKRLGWTQEKMSKETDIPLSTIQYWESGKEPHPHWKRYVLEDLGRRGRSEMNPEFNKILGEILYAMVGDRSPIPQDVIKSALNKTVAVHMQVRIMDEIRKEMGW